MWKLIFIFLLILENSILANITNKTDMLNRIEKRIYNKIAKNILLNNDKLLADNYLANTSDCWVADNGDGTYSNPIIYADYSDPDVVRVDNNYYMTASSFSSIPGLPILHSKDLVNWKLIGHALEEYPDKEFNIPQHGKGVWAPSIRHQNNCFYIYWGDPDNGIYMVRSKSITGPWEKPVLVLPGKGIIDPCPFWDNDGQAYIVHAWAASRAGVKSLLTLRKMNTEGTKVEHKGKHVFDGNDNHPTIEGPKLYKRNGYYYILAPAGGVKTGWQVALRSKNIYGPYEEKIVLEQGSTNINGPHQGGWVESLSGQSWFIHFQDCEAYGRITHLQPVKWQNDWPMMGQYNVENGKNEPVLTFKKPDTCQESQVLGPVTDDEFNTDSLGMQWQWQANPQLTWYALLPQTKYLRLFPHPLAEDNGTIRDAGNVLGQKFPAPEFSATTKLTFEPKGEGKYAGLTVMGKSYAYLAITEKDGQMVLSQVMCNDAHKGGEEEVIEEVSIPSNTVYLKVDVTEPDAECCFSYSMDGEEFSAIGKTLTATPNIWIGAKVGIFCVRSFTSRPGGHADFDWFRIE